MKILTILDTLLMDQILYRASDMLGTVQNRILGPSKRKLDSMTSMIDALGKQQRMEEVWVGFFGTLWYDADCRRCCLAIPHGISGHSREIRFQLVSPSKSGRVTGREWYNKGALRKWHQSTTKEPPYPRDCVRRYEEVNALPCSAQQDLQSRQLFSSSTLSWWETDGKMDEADKMMDLGVDVETADEPEDELLLSMAGETWLDELD